MSATKRPSARERLVERVEFYLDGYDAARDFKLTFRRLLRAHERELAERSVRAGMDFIVDHICDCPGRGHWVDYHYKTVCAAILGPERKRRAK